MQLEKQSSISGNIENLCLTYTYTRVFILWLQFFLASIMFSKYVVMQGICCPYVVKGVCSVHCSVANEKNSV